MAQDNVAALPIAGLWPRVPGDTPDNAKIIIAVRGRTINIRIERAISISQSGNILIEKEMETERKTAERS